MDHSYFKGRISAYLDDSLPPLEQKVIGEHLEECEECRKILAELRKVDELVERHSQLGGDEYWEKSAQKIEERLGIAETEVTDISARRGWGLGWKWATAVASVAVLVIIGIHQSDILKYRGAIPEKPQKGPTPRQLQAPEDVTRSGTEADVESRPISPSALGVEEADSSMAPVNEQEDQEAEELDTDKKRVGRGAKIGIPKPVAKEAELAGEVSTTKDKLSPLSDHDVGGGVIEASKKSRIESLSHRVQPMTATEAVVSGEVAQEREDVLTLDEWRHRKDSLERELESYAKVRSFGEMPDYKSDDVGESEQERGSRRQIEAGLLEACYRIAIISKDNIEVKGVTEIIEKMAGDSGAINQEKAAGYLEKLRR